MIRLDVTELHKYELFWPFRTYPRERDLNSLQIFTWKLENLHIINSIMQTQLHLLLYFYIYTKGHKKVLNTSLYTWHLMSIL